MTLFYSSLFNDHCSIIFNDYKLVSIGTTMNKVFTELYYQQPFIAYCNKNSLELLCLITTSKNYLFQLLTDWLVVIVGYFDLDEYIPSGTCNGSC